MVDTQWGSRLNGGECCFAQVYLAAVMSTARAHRSTAAALFIDLSAAFSSMIRKLAVPGVHFESDEEIARVLAWCAIGADDMADVMANVSKAAEWASLGVSEHTTALISKVHEHTWFSSEMLPGVVHSLRGALAGTTLADIIFSIAWQRHVV